MDHVARTTRSRRTRARERSRSLLRDTVVALSSAGVLAFLVAYAVAAPTAELSADVGPTVPRPWETAVVQGRVLTAGGGGLDGAQILVRSAGGTSRTATSLCTTGALVSAPSSTRWSTRGACLES